VAIIRELVREPLIRAQSSDELASGGLTVGDPPAGPIRLDGGRRLALVGVREVPLTGTEFAVLAVMLAAPGRPRSRGQLLAAAGRSGSDRAADVHIAALRAKIGVPGLIRTVRGAGWSIGESVPRRLS
jgi:DNA-binding response OmpR family regulator